MSTVIWIIIAYMLSVAITYPFIKKDARQYEEDGNDVFPFNMPFMAKIVAFVPVVNLYIGFTSFLHWVSLKLVEQKLKRIAQKYKTEDPELHEEFNEAIKSIKKYNEL